MLKTSVSKRFSYSYPFDTCLVCRRSEINADRATILPFGVLIVHEFTLQIRRRDRREFVPDGNRKYQSSNRVIGEPRFSVTSESAVHRFSNSLLPILYYYMFALRILSFTGRYSLLQKTILKQVTVRVTHLCISEKDMKNRVTPHPR